MVKVREKATVPFATARTVQLPGCDAGANPAIGNCEVKHSSPADGSSPYSAVVATVPAGSSHSTRN